MGHTWKLKRWLMRDTFNGIYELTGERATPTGNYGQGEGDVKVQENTQLDNGLLENNDSSDSRLQ